MPGEPIGPAAIHAFRDQRFKLEQLIALDLVEVFTTTQSLIQPLRQMARAAMTEMRANWQNDWMAGAIKEESELGMWRRGGGFSVTTSSIDRLLAETHLSVFDISDVIRLYGAIVERKAKINIPGAKAEDREKSSYRAAISNADKSTVWQDRRVRGTPTDPSTQSTTPQGRSLLGWQAPVFQKPDPGPAARGIDLKQANGKSTVRKIEDLFCLPVGADISGTTADSMHFIRTFCAKCNIPYDPVYQLLPLASIVRARHHALLEVALTLSSNDIVDYHIGFYETLTPRFSQHEGAAKMDSVFQKWTRHSWNNHVLIYFKKDQMIDGGWLFGDRDADPQFFELANVCENYTEFVNLWKPPDFTHVLNMIRRHQIRLKRELL